MATTDDVVTVSKAPAAVAAVPIAVTVDEFCAGLSATDRRPELIYAFSKTEKAAGHIKDDPENFKSRFAAFASKPV